MIALILLFLRELLVLDGSDVASGSPIPQPCDQKAVHEESMAYGQRS